MALAVAVLSGTIYIQHLKIAARDGQISGLHAALDSAADTNHRQKDAIDQLTSDGVKLAKRISEAQSSLTDARAIVETKTITITKEIARAASPKDDDPVPPGMAAALSGMLEQYGSANRH